MEKNQAGEPVLVLRWPSVNGKLYGSSDSRTWA